MKNFFLTLIIFLNVFSISGNEKEKLYGVGYTVTVVCRDKEACTIETLENNTIYLYEVQILFDSIYTNINANLYEQLKTSNEFGILTENIDFYVQRKKLVPGKKCEMKFKRIRDKEKKLYYNKF